ncbi:MAG: hypothetical protein K2O18_06730 [Oscillospiraceae bacterium]|nr:hypothetical protein [Oscillospiraceae bacterium]
MSTVSNAASQRSMSDFFYHPADKPIGPMPGLEYAYVRPELREEFLAYLHEQEKEGKAAELRAARAPGATTAKLTPNQIQQLKAKYDPHRMTQDEYAGFVQDLIDFGVLTDDHTPYLECPGVGVGHAPLFHTVGGEGGPCGPLSLAGARGDAMEWAKTQSLYRKYDEETKKYYPGRKAIAFSKVYSAMQQISQQSPASRQINYQQSQQTLQTSRLMFDLRNSRIAAPTTAARR